MRVSSLRLSWESYGTMPCVGTDYGQEWEKTDRDALQRKAREEREANGPIRFWREAVS
jgi:hypothetical protein